MAREAIVERGTASPEQPEYHEPEPGRRVSFIPYPDLPDQYYTEDEFRQQCTTNSASTFELVNTMVNEFKSIIADMQEDLDTKKETIADMRTELSARAEELAAKDDELATKNQQLEELVAERDQLQRTVSHMAVAQVMNPSRGGSVPPAEPRKSAKIPDPPLLTDGTDPKFENWVSKMRNKLKSNRDHYPTEDMRITYVESRVEGKALEHLTPRLRVDAVNPYNTAEEMFKHLESIFQNPNREANAQRDFRKLNMKMKESFQSFLSTFQHLAGEAKIPAAMYKDELHHRLTWRLQEATMREWMDRRLTFEEYAETCTKFADHLAVIQETRNRTRAGEKSTTTTDQKQREGTPTLTGTSTSRTPYTGTVYLSDERRELMRKGKCFYCKADGHILKDCPVKKKIASVSEIETQERQGNQKPENFQP